MKVTALKLDDRIINKLVETGITELYPPQADAVSKGLMLNENMVVAIPTASGKTLLAILAIFSNLLNKGGKAVYLSPLRALASEKYQEIKEFADEVGLRVAISTGDLDEQSKWIGGADIIIATNEKFDSLIRHQVSWLNDIRVVITDEVHLINDSHRGPVLEVVLTQLKVKLPDCQIVALSATINNADEIAEWLDAKLVLSDWRPVQLREGVWYDGEITFADGKKKEAGQAKDNTGYISLTMDMLEEDAQALIFANTRKSTVATAQKLSKKVKKTLSPNDLSDLLLIANKIRTVGEKTELRTILADCIEGGVGFHHAGLISGHRKLVEEGFRNRKLKAISASPTLCLSKDTKLWSGAEEYNISNFPSDKSLFTLYNKIKLIRLRPNEIIKNYNSNIMVEIMGVSGFSIKVTPNHIMYIKREGVKMQLPAIEVKPTDKIATIGKLDLKETKPCYLYDYIKDNAADIPNSIINENWSYFIGIMLGDGYSGGRTENNKIKYIGSPMLVNNENQILDFTTNLLDNHGIRYRKNRDVYGTKQIVITKKKWFREMLIRLGIEKGANKYIHPSLLQMNEKNISRIIRGLFDSDGFVQKDRNIGYSSSSFNLIMGTKKLLLRFGIVSRIRTKKPSTINTTGKIYKTKESYELIIANKNSIIKFYKNINFGIDKKQKALHNIILQYKKNLLYSECKNCNYKVYRSIFSGRSKNQKDWGKIKQQVINTLGEYGELRSKKLVSILGGPARKNDTRLNHHYQLISRYKRPEIDHTDYFWKLNEIGEWVYSNILMSGNEIDLFFDYDHCPLCNKLMIKKLREGWRTTDFDGDIYWDKIRKIKCLPTENEVYDVVLPNEPTNDHLFVANGFVVHNSAGINLPARRVIIRSVSRYSDGYYQPIPVLEYKQMSGRAGRPRFDPYGESLILAKNETEVNMYVDRFLKAETELIYSKLGSEPAMRSHILSFIASEDVEDFDSAMDIIASTFYGYQNEESLYFVEEEIDKVFEVLCEAKLISAEEPYEITPFGKRVNQLYLDPLSARMIKKGLEQLGSKDGVDEIIYLQMLANTPDLRIYNVRKSEIEELIVLYQKFEDNWLNFEEIEKNELGYDLFFGTLKIARVVQMWLHEESEEKINNMFNIASGDLHSLVSRFEWLVHSAAEIAKVFKWKVHTKALGRINNRIKYGISEDLLELVSIQNVGRVRARTLYDAGYKTKEHLQKASFASISKLAGIGTRLAKLILSAVDNNDERLDDSDEPKENIEEKIQTTLDTFFD